MHFELLELPSACEALRGEVRAFLNEHIAERSPVDRALSWSGGDPEFSRRLGARGWIGMTWPKRYGGGELSALQRYTVLEELLAAGAPVARHWIADRQSGPMLLRVGSEAQKDAILPAIARGECYFCIGMSEPDSGSDLASVRTRAEKTGGKWVINGSKVWTSGADQAHYMIALVRTGDAGENRHGGLSQFLLPMNTPGVEVSPIPSLGGDSDFNQVTFTDVELDDDALLGEEGAGWSQVTSELALERSGPERFLSSLQLLIVLCDALGPEPEPLAKRAIGECTAELAVLRQMSLSVAGMLEAGEDPGVQAALIKDLGARFEQSLVNTAQRLLPIAPALRGPGSDYAHVLRRISQLAPSYSLRGGTREILRGIIARGLGLR
ncbi:MAG: acyl-CoA dehydrogenase family protein [Gammaproteobacteria bacterium AqS3]|nr:acyl-CoA dehydrogenase family protein [Gammaproteobacteria bacterium AqS3]